MRKTWSTFRAMAYKEILVVARYPVEFVASFGQIFLIIAIFVLAGVTFSRHGGQAAPEVGGVVIYGFILYLFLNDTLWTIGYRVRREQVEGTLEQLYLSPASKAASLIARVTGILVWSGSLAVAGALMMKWMLGTLPFHHPLLGLTVFSFALLGTFGIGFAMAGITLRIGEGANTLANFLGFAFIVLNAHFFPFKALPQPVLAISRLLPTAYAVDAFRSALMGFPPGFPELAPFNIEVAIVVTFGLLMPWLGFAIYRRAEAHARRTGSLSQY